METERARLVRSVSMPAPVQRVWQARTAVLLMLTLAAAAGLFGLQPAAVVVAAAVLGIAGLAVVRNFDERRGAAASFSTTTESAPREEGADSERRPNLRTLVVVALGVRFSLGAILHFTGANLSIAPDSVAYMLVGCQVAHAWEAPGIDLYLVPGYKDTFYIQLNGLACSYFGRDAGLWLGFFNAGLGVTAAWVLSRLAFNIYGAHAARYAFALAAFFPSIALWTSLNLREGWSFLALSTAVYGAQQLRTRVSLGSLALLALGLAGLPIIRSYLLALVVAGLAASYIVVRARQLPAALLGLAAMLLVTRLATDQLGLLSLDASVADRLRLATDLRSGLAYGASAVDTELDTSTPLGAILYLPRGLATFLLAPFPWTIDSWRQAIAVPETLVWYYLLILAGREMWTGMVTQPSRVAAPMFVALAITLAYALVEGNAGTAYRHRAHVLLIAFVFAGGALAKRRRTGQRIAPNTASSRAPGSPPLGAAKSQIAST